MEYYKQEGNENSIIKENETSGVALLTIKNCLANLPKMSFKMLFEHKVISCCTLEKGVASLVPANVNRLDQ